MHTATSSIVPHPRLIDSFNLVVACAHRLWKHCAPPHINDSFIHLSFLPMHTATGSIVPHPRLIDSFNLVVAYAHRLW